jgi:hypothetical protein
VETKEIPLWAPGGNDLDAYSDQNFSRSLKNGIIQPNGSLRCRPPIAALAAPVPATYVNCNSGHGLFSAPSWAWEASYGSSRSAVIYAAYGYLGLLDWTAPTSWTDFGNKSLDGRVSFATTQSAVYLCGRGGGLYKITAAPWTCTSISLTGGPTNIETFCIIDDRLIANSRNENKVYFCEETTPGTWNASNFFQATYLGDPVVAVAALRRQLLVFGSRTFEVWERGLSSPFERSSGGTLDSGIAGPKAFVQTPKGIVFISNQKQFLLWDGNSLTTIISHIDPDLLGTGSYFNDVSLAYFELFGEGYVSVNVVTSSAYSDCYLLKLSDGTFWQMYQGANLIKLVSAAYDYDKWLLQLEGLSPNSRGIYYFSSSTTPTDVGSSAIVMESVTPQVTWGTNEVKRNNSLSFGVSGNASGTLAWTDEKGTSQTKSLTLIPGTGATRLRRLGTYVKRKYTITATPAALPFSMDMPREKFEVLR